MNTQDRLTELESLGFDRCRESGRDTIRIGCSQCDAVAINGTACHETGCPNQTRECRECGTQIPKGERCDCMDGELRDGDAGGYGHA